MAFKSELVNDLEDMARQLAGATDKRGEDAWHWPECLHTAAVLLLVREMRALRHHLEGQ